MSSRSLHREAPVLKETTTMDHELSSPAISTPDKRREVEVPLRTFHPFTQDQVQRLLSDPQLPQDRRTLYAIQLLTGARFNEAVALRWGDCDFASSPLGALQIAPPIKGRAYKHQHPRRVPIHPALHQILADWHSQGWGAVYGRVRCLRACTARRSCVQ